MDNRKFEQLIDMIINENNEQARELFHEIVVEKSREIYESMMMDETYEDDMSESGDMVGDLMDEVEADESMMEDDEEMDDMMDMADDAADAEDDEIDMDMDMDDMEADEGDLEERVVDLEDKLDELMAEFEALMSDKDEDMGDDDVMEGHADDEMMEAKHDEDEDEMDESVMEAIQLKKVSVTHGDNGVQTKSVVSKGPKVPGNGAAPVKFNGGSDEKGRSAPQTKDVDHASKWQNAAGKDMAKMGKAPAPTKSQASGSNTKDVVPGN